MDDDEELVLWGTLRGWSQKLGIPQDILRERFKDLPTQECLAKDPDDPEYEIVTLSYAEPDVRAACSDLVSEWPVLDFGRTSDTSNGA